MKYVESLCKDKNLLLRADINVLARLEELSQRHLPLILGILWGFLRHATLDIASLRTIWSVMEHLVSSNIKSTQFQFLELGGVQLALDTLYRAQGPGTETMTQQIVTVLYQIFIPYPNTYRHMEQKHVDRLLALCPSVHHSPTTRWRAVQIIIVLLYQRETNPRLGKLSCDDIPGKIKQVVRKWSLTERFPDMHPDNLLLYQDWLNKCDYPAIQFCGAWAIWYLIHTSASSGQVMEKINLERLQELQLKHELDRDAEKVVDNILYACYQHEIPEVTYDIVPRASSSRCDSAAVGTGGVPQQLTDSGFVSL
jgi:hypothetical protein